MKPKRITAFLLSVAMILSLMPTFSITALADETPTTEKNITLGTSALKGKQQSNVWFGNYQQSEYTPATAPESPTNHAVYTDSDGTKFVYLSKTKKYYKVEPVKWRVLDTDNDYNRDAVEGETDTTRSLFLLSDSQIEQFRYNANRAEVTWETSGIRSWLNGYTQQLNQENKDYSNDNFINATFSDEEKNVIAETNVLNNEYNGIVYGGNDTNDKIFLLSINEVQDSKYGLDTKEARASTFTNYILGGGKTEHIFKNQGIIIHWLRSPGINRNTWNNGKLESSLCYASAVYPTGSFYYSDYVTITNHVRPAFNIDVNSVLFTTPAVSGKNIEKGVDKPTSYEGTDYKLTVKDNSREFTVTESEKTAIPNGTFEFDYSNAKTGDNEYISAMITDKDEKEVLYYGQIKNIKKDSETSGKVKFKIPNDIALGEYKVKLFNEQINGDYKTDFSSDFVDVPLNIVKLSLHTNGGTINSGNLEYYQEGKTTTLPTDVTKEDCVFGGWYEKSDFSGSAVTEIPSSATGNKEYYAKWLEKVTFEVENTEHIYKKDTERNITFTPKSVSGNLTKDDFTVKYYKVDVNNEVLASATPAKKAIESGTYLYVIDFAQTQSDYVIENKYTVTDTTLPDKKYDNAGFMYINATAEQQDPMYFEKSSVNAYVTDGTVENKLVTNSTNGTITYESKNTSVANFNSEGVLEIKGTGTTIITATSRVTGKASTSASYTLNVTKKPVTVSAEIDTVTYGSEWDKTSASVKYSDNLTKDDFDGTLDFRQIRNQFCFRKADR